MKVYTLHGPEEFQITNYHIDAGYLILYQAEPADNNSVRLRPAAVFAPGGWLGYAPEGESDTDPERMGFRPQPVGTASTP
jgi:hypothetical protein